MELAIRHYRASLPSEGTHRHGRRWWPVPMMVAMARNENRQSEKDQRSDQAASPPAILPQHFALQALESRGERILTFLLASRFFSHRLLPP